MSNEAARYFEAAKDDDRTLGEVREDMRELNERVEWPVRELLPEVFGKDDEQRERARADD